MEGNQNLVRERGRLTGMKSQLQWVGKVMGVEVIEERHCKRKV